jgi:hypothetical protein
LAVVGTLLVAEITSNLTMASDPACLFIDVTTPEGQAAGLTRDLVVSCLALATVYADYSGPRKLDHQLSYCGGP